MSRPGGSADKILIAVGGAIIGALLMALFRPQRIQRGHHDVTLSQLTDDLSNRPLLPPGGAKALVVAIFGLFSFFAIWAWDTNAAFAAMARDLELMQRSQRELTQELRETNRLVQRLLAQVERSR